jgi:hypothetical protein
MLEMRTLAWAICTSLQVRRARLVGASQHQSPHPNVERRDVRVGAPVSGQGVPAALSRFLAAHSHSISTVPAQPVAYWR